MQSELAVRPQEEPLYELYEGESIDPVFGTYKSVYHWILAMADEAAKRQAGVDTGRA